MTDTNRKRIYVAAPINALAFDEAFARNLAIADALADAGYTALNPLDFPGASSLAGLTGDLDKHAVELGITTDEEIVRNCLLLIGLSDAVLFDLRGLRASGAQTWGTPCEMMYAWKRDIPCVAVADDFRSSWINVLCAAVRPTLEEAISLLPAA